MAVEFKLPKIAEGVESGDVLEILVSVGDTLEIEQEVMELETDKATIFVPSDVEGVITGINCGIGDTIAVGQVILSVEPATACRTCRSGSTRSPRASGRFETRVSSGKKSLGRKSHGRRGAGDSTVCSGSRR
jgi:pyruvate/2-oxoglutarate dehydrogenase complex dihydrolipoamide acyltransferase (E2) component